MLERDIVEIPQNFVRKTKVANIYATLVKSHIYGMERNIAVYLNPMKALNEREDSNSELSRIVKELDDLGAKCIEWDETKTHAEISHIVCE